MSAETKKKWNEQNQDKRRAYWRKYAKARREWLAGQKDKPCADCRKKYPTVCMQFDHVRGKKLFCIAVRWSGSIERLKREIAKCEVVCANCHAVRTSKSERNHRGRPTVQGQRK